MHPVATDIICDFSNVVASVHNELWQPACGIVLGVVTTKLNIPGHKRSSQPQFAVTSRKYVAKILIPSVKIRFLKMHHNIPAMVGLASHQAGPALPWPV